MKTAKLVVVAMTYACVVVGELNSGKITHCARFDPDILGAFVASDDPTILGIVVASGSYGGDILLQIPVEGEFNNTLHVLQVLCMHHVRRELDVKTLPTAHDVRGKVYLKGISGDDEIPVPDVAPLQLWSVANLTTRLTTDRMANVKNTFAVVDRDTKESVPKMKAEVAKAEQSLAKAKTDVENDIVAATEAVEVERKRKLDLDELEKEIVRITEAHRLSVSEYDRLRLQYSEEQERWSEILQVRQAQELKQRRTLVEQQRSNENTLNLLRQDIVDCEARGKEASAVIALYENEKYAALCEKRDLWLVNLTEVAEELEALHSKDAEHAKRVFSAMMNKVLKTNSALRELIVATGEELEQENRRHKDLLRDIESFNAEIDVFGENEELMSAKVIAVRDQLGFFRGDVQSLQDNIELLETEVDECENNRSFFLVARERLSSAVQRRVQLERAARQQREEQRTRRNNIQHQLFEAKLKDISRRYRDGATAN